MLVVFTELCDMCRRLLALVRAQQIELERLHADRRMLDQWNRETDHIEDMFKKKIED